MRWLKKKIDVDPRSFVSCPGSRKKKVLAPFYDGKKLTLIESGEIDIQDSINAHAAECDMSFILSRLNQGDFTVLNNSPVMFADFRNLPGSFMEVLNVALNSERVFDQLPVDVRQRFDNDYRRFLASSGSEEWRNIMSPYLTVPGSASDTSVHTTDTSGGASD